MKNDVITLITDDHRKIEELFERIKSGQGDQKKSVLELHALLTAHARAEEDRVYPGLDAHHSLEEHKEAEILMDSVRRAEPGSPEFRQALDKLIKSVTQHVQEEENEILPKLADKTDEKQRSKLGAAFMERRKEEMNALAVEAAGARPPRQRKAEGEHLTKAELYERAQQADIPGRSHMSREELEKALQKAGA
ncbi:hemerythrin superfamily protein [Thermocatellispora tengchongensis]|uniref:Hemerythrin superfamily protein n=1 Tax=Thermocatellispora tengchongensis TaxID=1073253 RepID=A0A840PIA5_9ACTN|nr:hemerythrin domain-containing protein [Thermocatellispora tengchongensis]MBB5137531.1 hemerythrin superfamily protein [Thermocatellispora tengchongensis]